MQIIDSCRVLAPLRETSVSLERCRLVVFDVAFGVGENAILANTAQSDVLRHSGPQTSASTIRNEGWNTDFKAISRQTARTATFTALWLGKRKRAERNRGSQKQTKKQCKVIQSSVSRKREHGVFRIIK